MEVKALACELPSEKDLPFSRFSCGDIAHEAVRRGIGASISGRTVWRCLDADAIRPWRYRSWIYPRDKRFAEKAGRVLDLYQGVWDGQFLGPDDYAISADEKTSIQARGRLAEGTAPAFDADISVVGSGGDDTLVVNAVTGSGSISFDGGTGSDTLAGPALANNWSITAANAGTLNTVITFTGTENLSGGGVSENLAFDAGATISGLIDGRGGEVALTSDDTLTIPAGAVATAGGNILIKSSDDTRTYVLVGSLGLGFGAVGIGGSVGLTVILFRLWPLAPEGRTRLATGALGQRGRVGRILVCPEAMAWPWFRGRFRSEWGDGV